MANAGAMYALAGYFTNGGGNRGREPADDARRAGGLERPGRGPAGIAGVGPSGAAILAAHGLEDVGAVIVRGASPAGLRGRGR